MSRGGEYKNIGGHWVKVAVQGRPVRDPRVCVDLEGRDCEGSHMPAEARRSEPGNRRSGTGNPEHAFDPVEVPSGAGNDASGASRTLSDEALELVRGPRAAEYDAPSRNMVRIGQTWGAMLGLEKPIPSWRVALMLAALKVIRAAHKPGDDSLIDAVGYLEIARELRPGDSMWVEGGLVNR